MEEIREILRRSFAQSTRNNQNLPKTCAVCGEPRLKAIEYQGLQLTVPVVCRCEKARMQKEQIEAENARRMLRFKELQRLSLMGKRYENVTFESSDTGFSPSFEILRKLSSSAPKGARDLPFRR